MSGETFDKWWVNIFGTLGQWVMVNRGKGGWKMQKNERKFHVYF